ncbi:MAG: LysM peptidoglycan-binding domain-containing protein [Planctomycetes bacterium]|nr:LysM peptidoglycan-binding domain-containing protein [Planctomycetota bacterium]
MGAVIFLLVGACGKPKPAAPSPVANKAGTAGANSGDNFDTAHIPGRIHLVQANETLWSLAELYYGNSKHWRKISVANRKRVTDPTNLPVGMKLIIP